MILKVFSIYDSATEAYNQPFFMLTQAEAIRAFSNMAIDPDTNISKHPADYHLYFLGTYDNASGYLNQDEKIKSLGSAQEYKQNKGTVEEMFPEQEKQA